MLVDRFGPRIVYSILLVVSGLLCLVFALSSTFEQLAIARFLMGFVGAGFVIGIRLISEWFPAKEVGIAEGVYGGWGNFGSAAAAMSLPGISLLFGGENGWRYAVASVGMLAIAYSVVFYLQVTDTPRGSTYFKPKRTGGMEVSTLKDLILYIALNIPMFLALALLNWKLGAGNLALLSSTASYTIYALLIVGFFYQTYSAIKINVEVLKCDAPDFEKYKFSQVAVLSIAYFVTFGSELAVVSMLPIFFMDTFSLGLLQAGMLASGFAFMNLLARPLGGLISDKFGRKKSLLVFVVALAVGYWTLGQINAEWPLLLAVIATMVCSFFVQSGEGAVFSVVPLVKRRLTGQIAGITGAYGNVGAVFFLTMLSFLSTQVFFYIMAISALIAVVIIFVVMEEPAGHMVEYLPDGTVQMIEVT